MTNLSTLEQSARPWVGDCIFPVVHQSLCKAARDFFSRTFAWSEVIELNAEIGVNRYVLSSETEGAEVIYIHGMRNSNKSPISRAAKAKDIDDGRTSATIRAFASDSPCEAVLYPIPSATATLYATVALRPSAEQMEIPDHLFSLYSDYFVDGALSELLSIKSKEWYDPNEARKRRIDFQRGIASAKNLLDSVTSIRPAAWV